MRLNRHAVLPSNKRTHEGATASRISTEQSLRRSVLSCLLFEDTFYESGEKIADRIEDLAGKVSPYFLAALAVEARTVHNLRHVPLLLLSVLAHTGAGKERLVSSTIEKVIQRADELAEFLAVYWRRGKIPLSAQIKKGLAAAFKKFDEYQLAKYNRDTEIKLRDVLFLTHPKPDTAEQAGLWKKLANNELATPDTWEVALSRGDDKAATFERMLREGTLGYLALLRNLRNMQDSHVDRKLVTQALLERKNGANRVLPFRYVAAWRAAPSFADAIDTALRASLADAPKLNGRTVVLVDVSGSMDARLSGKSDLSRADAAATLASVLNAEDLRVLTFSSRIVEVPNIRGIGGIESVLRSQRHSSTELASAVDFVNKKIPHDRLIVITDEQARVAPPSPVAKNAYMINVASYQNGVGYGKWTHIDGFSENVIRWIHEYEKES